MSRLTNHGESPVVILNLEVQKFMNSIQRDSIVSRDNDSRTAHRVLHLQ